MLLPARFLGVRPGAWSLIQPGIPNCRTLKTSLFPLFSFLRGHTPFLGGDEDEDEEEDEEGGGEVGEEGDDLDPEEEEDEDQVCAWASTLILLDPCLFTARTCYSFPANRWRLQMHQLFLWPPAGH